MADKKAAVIIIKKKKGGHGGAHGGAWKVAYADFVTAMMALFLVLWLLGSDEETKSSVANYFNNPTSAWRKDLNAKDTVPLGDMTGAGEDILSGAGAGTPQDLIERPTQVMKQKGESGGAIMDELLKDQGLLKLDVLRFTVQEDQIFKKGTQLEWTPEAGQLFSKLKELTKNYSGSLMIKGFYEEKSEYESQLNRTIAVEKYLVDHNLMDQERLSTVVVKQKSLSSSDDSGPRLIEFSLAR